MPDPSATILRIYYTRPVVAECGLCGTLRRVSLIDLDCHYPLCRDCLSVSIQAADALRRAGLPPPDMTLTEFNP